MSCFPVPPQLKGPKGHILAARIEVPILAAMIYGVVGFIRLGWSQAHYLYTYAPVLGGVAASAGLFTYFFVVSVERQSNQKALLFLLGFLPNLYALYIMGVLGLYTILEGVIAWYHPQDGSASNEQYFLIKGQAALIGTLFGSIDFVIIKAEVHILAKASAMVLIEAHQPTQVELKLLVEVSASVKILFFTVSFSFRMELDLAFTVGSASPTPWIVTTPPKNRRRSSPARIAQPIAIRTPGRSRALSPCG